MRMDNELIRIAEKVVSDYGSATEEDIKILALYVRNHSATIEKELSDAEKYMRSYSSKMPSWCRSDQDDMTAMGLHGAVKRYRRFRLAAQKLEHSNHRKIQQLEDKLKAMSGFYQIKAIEAICNGDPSLAISRLYRVLGDREKSA